MMTTTDNKNDADKVLADQKQTRLSLALEKIEEN